MPLQFTQDFSAETAAKFKQEPITWRHNLPESSLFSDEALIKLIDNHPRDYADFCTMNEGADDMGSWRGGDPGGHSGAELLQAVRQGRLWINLRQVCNINPEYQSILHDMTEQMREKIPSFKPVSMMGGILISSPTAGVPFHIDRSDVMLWHIRGHKRVWVYPMNDSTLPEAEVEEILLHDHNDDVPYHEGMDEQALIIDMKPGMVATWALHAPHRVLNQGDMNVSIAVEWSPFSSVMQNGAQITNGILRRKLGMNPNIETQGTINRFVRFLLSRVLRKLKLVKAKSATAQGYMFDVAPENNDGIAEYPDKKAAA
ncbi:hypothetical protein MNBD_ALPHA06-2245 [hydrothermal vent metagenome]|uniref:JmjC domain-containing protein n=1 Tax=hydrothermal vent metagenome TaxID=652676 RepID=A0A3B0RUW6_9ZZZZ